LTWRFRDQKGFQIY